jgi:hypothetical protein
MKNSLACPKCQSRKLYCVSCLSDYSEDYVCAACGYTETWTNNFDQLLTYGADGGVRVIDTTPTRGEYR